VSALHSPTCDCTSWNTGLQLSKMPASVVAIAACNFTTGLPCLMVYPCKRVPKQRVPGLQIRQPGRSPRTRKLCVVMLLGRCPIVLKPHITANSTGRPTVSHRKTQYTVIETVGVQVAYGPVTLLPIISVHILMSQRSWWLFSRATRGLPRAHQWLLWLLDTFTGECHFVCPQVMFNKNGIKPLTVLETRTTIIRH
jgi:hypothetical protein